MEPGWGWGAFILPYIDQAPLFQQGEIGSGGYILLHPEVYRAPLSAYRCPSDVEPKIVEHSIWGRMQPGYEAAAGNYVAAHDHRQTVLNATATGAFFKNSDTRIRDITDGTSNTIAVGERSVRGTDGYTAPVWAGCAGCQHSSDFAYDLAGTGLCTINSVTCGNTSYARSFGSPHVGGVQFLLLDGSVRFISENIQHSPGGSTPNSNFEYLLAIADGKVVGEF